ALYKAGRTLQAYGEVEPRKETFAQLANLLCTDKKAAELETLIALHRPHADGDPDLLFYEARAKVFRKQPAQALPLLQKAHQTQTEQFRRRMYVSSWVQDMLEMGDGLEGYRTAPDRAAAFETLAPMLVSQKKKEELAKLLDEHGKVQ